MSQPYVGQILMFAGNFAPEGWVFCDGALLSISDYAPLYQLLGTIYGGDGQTTFGVPDLRSRVPISQSGTYPLAQVGGLEQVTMTSAQLPTHTHLAATTGVAGTTNVPSSSAIFADQAGGSGISVYSLSTTGTEVQFGPSIGITGSSGAHANIQPYQAINYCIATYGDYPMQA